MVLTIPTSLEIHTTSWVVCKDVTRLLTTDNILMVGSPLACIKWFGIAGETVRPAPMNCSKLTSQVRLWGDTNTKSVHPFSRLPITSSTLGLVRFTSRGQDVIAPMRWQTTLVINLNPRVLISIFQGFMNDSYFTPHSHAERWLSLSRLYRNSQSTTCPTDLHA